MFLVAQYESFGIPVAVIASVPIGILGALTILVTGHDLNIYTQVGLVILIGLGEECHFGGRIREAATRRRRPGILEAAANAARLRFRAVLMTAISFVLGMIPLVIATGAGAASQTSLGQAVFGGMCVNLIAGTFLVPSFMLLYKNSVKK